MRLKKLLAKDDRFISHCTAKYNSHEVFIMEKHGTAFCELYWWDEDRSVIYIKLLSVDKWCRRRHLGTSLLKLCEQIGIEIGSVIACLTVKKHTWVHTWYKRKGYKDTETNYQDRTFMDMKKYLSKGESTNE